MATAYFARSGELVGHDDWEADHQTSPDEFEPYPQDLVARSELEDASGRPGEIVVLTSWEGYDVEYLVDRPGCPLVTVAYEVGDVPRIFARVAWETRAQANAGHWWLVDAIRSGVCRPSGTGRG
jgi:hypothetical protein